MMDMNPTQFSWSFGPIECWRPVNKPGVYSYRFEVQRAEQDG